MEVKSKKKICIVGTGGFGREVLTCICDLKLDDHVVFMIDDSFFDKKMIMGIEVIKRSEFTADDYKVIVAIADPHKRKKMVESLPSTTQYTSIIHPRAVISKWVEIGEGSIITAGVILTCNIKIGQHAHINLNSTIGHDCTIGNYFTCAPATNISGNCHLGNCVYFGTKSSIKEGVSVCDNVTVGMGGVVTKNIDKKGVYIGSPVTFMKEKLI
jgi:sugar O-acyltransferase (sialic acid O-acetyltransferase NeuD family)